MPATAILRQFAETIFVRFAADTCRRDAIAWQATASTNTAKLTTAREEAQALVETGVR